MYNSLLHAAQLLQWWMQMCVCVLKISLNVHGFVRVSMCVCVCVCVWRHVHSWISLVAVLFPPSGSFLWVVIECSCQAPQMPLHKDPQLPQLARRVVRSHGETPLLQMCYFSLWTNRRVPADMCSLVPICLFVCWLICARVSRITHKLPNRFQWNLGGSMWKSQGGGSRNTFFTFLSIAR